MSGSKGQAFRSCCLLLALFVIALVPATRLSSQEESTLAVRIEAHVVAIDREASGERIADWANSSGGYFVVRSLDQVIVRVPPERLPELRAVIALGGDTVVAYRPATEDARQELAHVDAAISARTEALERVLDYLDDADVAATLAFERELRSLNQEIEAYAGRRRAILNDVRFASVSVAFSMRQSSIPSKRPSSFDWINTVDLYRFLDTTAGLGATR
jgi:hypothetical protein